MSTIAVIPARGKSKRIPRKNIRLFAGKPIIAYSIEAALGLDMFDRVIVSTDDEEIADVGRQYGADVPFVRPAELADDFTGTNAVVKHAIEWFVGNEQPVSIACCIYATAPFIQASHLEEGYRKLIASDKAYVFSIARYSSPIQRAIRLNKAGEIVAVHPENYYVRSQDLEESYHDAGQFYWGRAEAFLNDVIPFSPVSLPVILPSHLVQDIDTPEDWRRAELLFKALMSE